MANKKGLFHWIGKYVGKYNPKEWYARFPDTGKKVYDVDVAQYAFKHLRLIDCFDIRKVTSAILMSFTDLSQDDPKDRFLKPNEKFKF